jgi:anti-sigma regulatory factor (Ser/Thr protein kinase)
MDEAHKTMIRLRPELGQVPELAAQVEAWGEEVELGPGDVMALTLATEELFANTIHHGGCDPGEASVAVELSVAGDAITVGYSDAGREFDTAHPDATPVVDPDAPVQDRAAGGLGLHFIRKTMESFNWERREGRNVTTLVRRRGAKSLPQ